MSSHLLDFNGRSSRREFWRVVIPVVLWNIGYLGSLAILFPPGSRSPPPPDLSVVLLVLVPDALALAAVIRRLHDLGCSGVWILAVSIPLKLVLAGRYLDTASHWNGWYVLAGAVLAIGLAYLGLKKGMAGDNRFGPPPSTGPAAPET